MNSTSVAQTIVIANQEHRFVASLGFIHQLDDLVDVVAVREQIAKKDHDVHRIVASTIQGGPQSACIPVNVDAHPT
jgi:hypothetical protein